MYHYVLLLLYWQAILVAGYTSRQSCSIQIVQRKLWCAVLVLCWVGAVYSRAS